MFYLYIISYGLQIAGAAILIYQYWGNIKYEILKEYYSGGNCNAKRDIDNDETVILELNKLRQTVKRIYIKRISFIYIISGLLLNVLTGSENSAVYSVVVVLLSSFVFLYLGVLFSDFLSKILYKTDQTTTFKELDELGIDVITSTSNSEIDALFKGSDDNQGRS